MTWLALIPLALLLAMIGAALVRWTRGGWCRSSIPEEPVHIASLTVAGIPVEELVDGGVRFDGEL